MPRSKISLPGTTTLPECKICGNVIGVGDVEDCDLFASDAQAVLQTAVGLEVGCTLDVCDYNGSGEVTTLDALATLRDAVGLPSNPQCPAIQVTTTTTTAEPTTTTTVPL